MYRLYDATLQSPQSLLLPRYHNKTHFKAATGIFLKNRGSLQANPGELEKSFMIGEESERDNRSSKAALTANHPHKRRGMNYSVDFSHQ